MIQKLTLLFLLTTTIIFGQNKNEIAGVYFRKAEKHMEKIDYAAAKKSFEKGVSYLDGITSKEVAQQGTFIYFELKDYTKSQSYASEFFKIAKDKNSEDYQQMLELFVDMEDVISKEKEEIEKKAKIKLEKERELKKIDSLKKAWEIEKTKYTIGIDSLYNFNKKGIALYEKGKYFGLMDDIGGVLLEADKYEWAIENEGYFIFLNDEREPTEIYSYNIKTDRSIEIISPSKYDEELDDYGKIMMPRGNGRLVMYPENYTKTLVYDLEQEKFVRIANIKDFLKELKKENIIDKYDAKERTVKIGKEWYVLGNHLGGSVYTLYSVDNKDLKSYLFSEGEEPKVVAKSEIGYLGAYFNNKLEASSKKNTLWLTNEGVEGSKPMFKSKYKGGTTVVKVKDGFQLVRDGVIFLENKKLIKLVDFLKENK